MNYAEYLIIGRMALATVEDSINISSC